MALRKVTRTCGKSTNVWIAVLVSLTGRPPFNTNASASSYSQAGLKKSLSIAARSSTADARASARQSCWQQTTTPDCRRVSQDGMATDRSEIPSYELWI